MKPEIPVVLCSVESRVSATAAKSREGQMKEESGVEVRAYECGTQHKREGFLYEVRAAVSEQLVRQTAGNDVEDEVRNMSTSGGRGGRLIR